MDAAFPACVDAGSTPLDTLQIKRALSSAWPDKVAVEAVAVTGSTNQDLAAQAREHQPSHCVLRAADFQTSGRGRHQRAWHAAPGAALLFSVAIPIATVPELLPAITLACGVALAECLAQHGVAVQLKWPNDVRVDHAKLAGILTELVLDRKSRFTLIIGVGVNLRLDEAARGTIGQPAIALEQLLATPTIAREQWIGELGGAIIGAAQRFVRDGFEPFMGPFNQLLEARGEWVNVHEGEKTVIGRVLEVDRLGRLVIDVDGVRRSLSVGDVSVRARR